MKRNHCVETFCEIKDVEGILCDVTATAEILTHDGEIDWIKLVDIQINDEHGTMKFEGIEKIPHTHFHKVDIDTAEQALEDQASEGFWEQVAEDNYACREDDGYKGE